MKIKYPCRYTYPSTHGSGTWDMFEVNIHQKEVEDVKKLNTNWKIKSGGIRFDQISNGIKTNTNRRKIYMIYIYIHTENILSTDVSMLIDTCRMMILAFCAPVSWMLSTASLGMCLCGRNRWCSNNSSCKSHGWISCSDMAYFCGPLPQPCLQMKARGIGIPHNPVCNYYWERGQPNIYILH